MGPPDCLSTGEPPNYAMERTAHSFRQVMRHWVSKNGGVGRHGRRAAAHRRCSTDRGVGEMTGCARATVALMFVLAARTHATAGPARSVWADFADRARLFCAATTGSALLTVVDMNADGRDELLLSHSKLCDPGYCRWFVYSPLSTAGHVLYVGEESFEPGRVRLTAGTHQLCGCWKHGDAEKEQCTALEFNELVAYEVTPCQLTSASAERDEVLQLQADGVCASAPKRTAWVAATGGRLRQVRVPDVGRLEVQEYPDARMVLSLVQKLETKAVDTFDGLGKLSGLGAAATPAIPSLLCLIQEQVPNTPVPHGGDADLRMTIETLSSIGPAIIPPIVEVLDSPCGTPVGRRTDGRGCRIAMPLDHGDREYCAWVRSWLADALAALDPSVVPQLVAAFQMSGRGRPYLADVFGAFGKQGVAAIPVLAEALNDGDAPLRVRCATALGRMGPAAAMALPRLRGLTEDADPQVRAAVNDAVARIERRER